MKKVNVAVKEVLIGKNCWSWLEQITIFIGTFNCVLFLWTPPINNVKLVIRTYKLASYFIRRNRKMGLIGWITRHWHQNFIKPFHEKDEGVNLAWWLHKVSVPCPRTYDQKWWFYLSSQRKNIMSELFPKHAAFLSRYFNHELCTNNTGLDARDALHKNMSDGILKLLRTWIRCGCRASSGCKGPGTQRHKRSFSWKSCN